MITLYPHQKTFVDNIRETLKTNQAVLARAETGFGKTVCAAYIALKCDDLIMTVHRKSLLKQTRNTFKSFGLSEDKVQMVSCLKKIKPPRILVVDESHHSMSKTWRNGIQRLKDSGTYVIGLTATPQLLSGQGLGEVYDKMIQGVDMKWLINNGYLSKYDYYSPYVPNMSGASKKMGDYAVSDVVSVMDGRVINDAIGKYKSICGEQRVIAFLPSIESSKIFVKLARDKNVNAFHLDGNSTEIETTTAIESFSEKGGIISNVGICGEGWDLSAQIGRDVTVEGVMLLRPTASLVLYRQQVGRALRKKDYKAKILDFSGNMFRHGMPDDVIAWSLDGKAKNPDDKLAIQRCPDCFHVQTPSPLCRDCGHEFKADGKIIEEIEGELLVIDSEEWKRAMKEMIENASTYPELIIVEKRIGEKFKWAERQYLKKANINLWANKEGLRIIAKERGYSEGWVWTRMNARR